MHRIFLNVSLFLLGFTSIVGQAIVLRELTITFYGNEFFLGLTLASWLLWVAIGSAAPRLGGLRNLITRETTLALTHIAAVVFLFGAIVAIRYGKSVIGLPGEIPNLVFASFVALFAPAPVCLVLGAWWTTASSQIARIDRRVSFSVNRAYLIETIGFIAGGVLASFVLVTLPAFTVVLTLGVLNVGHAALSLRGRPWLSIFVLVLIALGSYALIPSMARVERMSEQVRFTGQRILEIIESPFGQLAVTEIGTQRNFFESGLMIGSDEEPFAAEKITQIPLLEHDNPKSVLIIGGGWSGALNEILEHGVKEIFYLELDPALIGMADRYLPPILQHGLAHQNVHLVYDDGNHFLRRTDKRFDVIIANLPPPSTALINRYYTEEFFRLAAKRLTPKGVFATELPYAPDQPVASLVSLDASVVKAFRAAFSQVLMLPDEDMMLIGSNGDGLSIKAETLVKRYQARGLKNEFVTESYIAYRLTNDRIAQAEALMHEEAGVKINREFRPIASFYQTLFWLDHFYPKLSRAYAWTAAHFWPIAVGLLLLATLVLIRRPSPLMQPATSVAIAGFSLMAAEIVIIFAYQTLVGFLYYRLALLIAALMAGMALGVWLANRHIERGGFRAGQLLFLHVMLAAFSLLLFPALLAIGGLPLGFAQTMLLALAEMAGMLGALVFPFANHLFLSSTRDAASKTGLIYSADVAGSALGAILPSVIIIPLFGVWQALLFVALVNLWAIVLIGRGKR